MQRRFSTQPLGLENLSYDDHLTNQKINKLEQGRLISDLTMCYKILYGYINVNTPNAFVRNFSVAHDHNYKLIKQLPFSNKRVNMYFDRVVNYWNTLPKDYIVNSRTVNKFKFLIRNINSNACIEDTR